MKLRTQILTGAAVAGALVFFAVSSAHSQPPGGFGHGPRGGHHGGPGGGPDGHHALMFILHGLDLTDEQKTQIEALTAARQETAETQHEAMTAARTALHQLVLTGTYSDEAAEPHVQAIATASGEFARLHAKLGNEIYNLLTPEQREEFVETLAKVEERHGRHGH